MTIKPSNYGSERDKPSWIQSSQKALVVMEAVRNQKNTDDLLEERFWKDFEASLKKLEKIFSTYIENSTNLRTLKTNVEKWKKENRGLLITSNQEREVVIAFRFEEFF